MAVQPIAIYKRWYVCCKKVIVDAVNNSLNTDVILMLCDLWNADIFIFVHSLNLVHGIVLQFLNNEISIACAQNQLW